MKKYAAVFPGQGSQSVGMAADFMSIPSVAELYSAASEVVGFDLKALSLNGPEEELNRTENTQPALLTASVAAYSVLRDKVGFAPAAVAGHSLGEYSALVAAGVIEFTDAVRLVRLRGQAMQEAVPPGVGAMAAVLGLDDETVAQCCRACAKEGAMVWPANFNSPGQVVISGHKSGVEAAGAALVARGAKKVVPLAVSVPSHCPLMEGAARRLSEALGKITLKDAAMPVYCNSNAQALTDAGSIAKALLDQLTGPVRWTQCVLNMRGDGVEVFAECGCGKVLGGLIRRIDKGAAYLPITDIAQCDKAASELSAQ